MSHQRNIGRRRKTCTCMLWVCSSKWMFAQFLSQLHTEREYFFLAKETTMVKDFHSSLFSHVHICPFNSAWKEGKESGRDHTSSGLWDLMQPCRLSFPTVISFQDFKDKTIEWSQYSTVFLISPCPPFCKLARLYYFLLYVSDCFTALPNQMFHSGWHAVFNLNTRLKCSPIDDNRKDIFFIWFCVYHNGYKSRLPNWLAFSVIFQIISIRQKNYNKGILER